MSTRRLSLRRAAALALAGIFAATSLAACSGGGRGSSDDTVRIGTTDETQKSWTVFKDKAKENNINLEVVPFSDYSTPNTSLSENQLDVNLFQHLKFLAEYNTGSGKNLVPVGSTQIVPLALFWKDHSSLDGIEGQSVTIPNDPSNQGRAINVLVQADLIKLKTEGLVTPTPADIDEGASKVKVTPVEAVQTSVAYGEGTPAVINNSFLDRAGIDPKTAIFKDDPASPEAEPYINVFVTNADKKDDPKIAKLVELWHDPEVIAANDEDSKGTSVAVKRPKEDLEKILKRLEDTEKENK